MILETKMDFLDRKMDGFRQALELVDVGDTSNYSPEELVTMIGGDTYLKAFDFRIGMNLSQENQMDATWSLSKGGTHFDVLIARYHRPALVQHSSADLRNQDG